MIAIWDLGHIAAFTIWTSILFRAVPRISAFSLGKQALLVLSFSLLVGGGAEIVQTLHRISSPNPWDMSRNVVGALTGWLFFTGAVHSESKILIKTARAIVVVLLCICCFPLIEGLYDERQIKEKFPVLVSFEHHAELGRLTGNAKQELGDPGLLSGNSFLKIVFGTEKYSIFGLKYFSEDWRGYTTFYLKLYNPEKEELKVTLRINDKHHKDNGYKYSDRFNRRITIAPGWTEIAIPLAEMTKLKTRSMDFQQMDYICLFTVSRPHPGTLYLEEIGLR